MIHARSAKATMNRMFAALFAVGIVLAAWSHPAEAHRHGATAIVAARALPLGSRVTIEGTVSTPSGAFASSFFDAGFGVQDDCAGIYVSLSTDVHVVPGDRVRVTGVLGDSYGLLVLLPDAASDVVRRGHDRPPEARRMTTGAIGESSEGLLVAVRGTITRAPAADGDYGFKLFVDDGTGERQIFVNLETGIDLSSLAVGDRLKVVGFSSQFEADYEIDPRFAADITSPEGSRDEPPCGVEDR